MGIFDRFPYSSTHEMNLDFMLGKATEIAEDMQRVTAGMEQVQAGLSAISEKTEQATQAAAQAAASASSIEGSVSAAEEAAEEAQMHNESAQTWANNALTYKADCQRAATEAAASSSSAAQAATAAAASEDTVATYAQAANASAQSAANNNDSAHQYANQASASASNATFHSSNAQTAATNANTSATNAETAATNAQTAATRTAALKDDCETLHRMCTAAVDQAATEAVNAANSAAQAAATKTDVENLVESLPEDFTDLNNTVNQLSDEKANKSELYNIENGYLVMDYTDGEYINSSTGAVEQNSSYMRTDYVDCEGFDMLVFDGVTHATSNSNAAFYDANKERINAAFAIDVNHTTVMVPSNAKWFRVSGEKSKGYFSTVRVVNPNGIPQILYNRDLIYNLYKQLEPQDWQTGKYVNYSTGAISSAAAWNAIEIIPTGKYIATNANATASGAIVFLDSNGTILERYKNMGNYVRVYSVPENTAVCRLCYNRNDAGETEVFVIGGKISDEAPILSVIGDSISSDNATGYKPCNYLAWPKMLVNKFGGNVKLDRHTIPGKKLYDALISDCAAVDGNAKMVVVMLGINDIGKGYTMGDIDTIMSQPLEDVETNTLMGVYRKGLETLKNRLSNDSVIVCISPVTNQQIDAWGDSTAADFRASYEELITLRESIKKMVIAEGSAENGWIYIDGRSLFELSTDSLNLYYGKKLDGTSDYTHLNLCGESILASAIFNMVIPIGCITSSNYIT